MASRIACVRIPRFPLAATYLSSANNFFSGDQLTLGMTMGSYKNPDMSCRVQQWDMLPLAIVRDNCLCVISLAAARSGVRIGMSTTEAGAVCADLKVSKWNDSIIDAAVKKVTERFLSASPQVTPGNTTGIWWVGLDGFVDIHIVLKDLYKWASEWHSEVRIGVADTSIAARVATWTRISADEKNAFSRSLTIVPSGGCREFLASAPLGFLVMPEELREGLNLLGMRTLGDFAALDSSDVEARWGRHGLSCWRLARGIDNRRPSLVRSDVERSVYTELLSPADTITPICFSIRSALEKIVKGLVEDGRAAASVAITLDLDSSSHSFRENAGRRTSIKRITREARPASSLASVSGLLEQCMSLLEGWVLSSPVVGVTVHIPATTPLVADQGDMLVRSWREEAASIESVLARIASTMDPDRTGEVIVHPERVDSHRYDRNGQWDPVNIWKLSESVDDKNEIKKDIINLTFRIMESPEPVSVLCTDNIPSSFKGSVGRYMVKDISGPEIIDTDWWKRDSCNRSYWYCWTMDYQCFLLYKENDKWFMQGWFD